MNGCPGRVHLPIQGFFSGVFVGGQIAIEKINPFRAAATHVKIGNSRLIGHFNYSDYVFMALVYLFFRLRIWEKVEIATETYF